MSYVVVLLSVIIIGLAVEAIPTNTRKALGAIVIIAALVLGLAQLAP
jgi:hypothetical protein